MNMISFLHVTQDNKFFDVIKNRFETDNRISNTSIIIVDKYNYIPKFIEKGANVSFIHKNDLKKYLEQHTFDVFFFHSLPPDSWEVLKYLSSDTTAIWWAWGYDIYDRNFGLKPLIPINLYKPATAKFIIKHNCRTFIKDFIIKHNRKYNIKKAIKNYIISYKQRKERNDVISRIDYFQPVIIDDYNFMLNNIGFRAKLFYYHNSIVPSTTEYKARDPESPILVGNSATSSNNHFDIFNKLETLDISSRKIIVPFNYGENWYLRSAIKKIYTVKLKIDLITDYLPKNKYFELMNTCGFAIFGVMRQKAMGNIFQCIRQGIKVFLYKDSVVYHYLKNYGFAVFSIDDMTKEGLETPLTYYEHAINFRLLIKQCEERNEIYEQVMNELQMKYE